MLTTQSHLIAMPIIHEDAPLCLHVRFKHRDNLFHLFCQFSDRMLMPDLTSR